MVKYTLLTLILLFVGQIADVPIMFLALHGDISLAFVFIAGFLTDVTPDFFWYGVGRRIGISRFEHLPIFRNNTERIEKLDRAFHKYGGFILFSSKFIVGTGIASQVIAGAHRYNIYKAFVANALGSLSWLTLLYALARYFGSISVIQTGLEDIKYALLIFVLLVIGIRFLLSLPLGRSVSRS